MLQMQLLSVVHLSRLAVLSPSWAWFKTALKKRVITYNPAYDITLPQPIKTNHKAIVNEKELKELLVKIWRYCAGNPRARKRTELAIKLSAYIYQRPNEVRHLLWESVDFDNQCLSFVASKTHQDHIVPYRVKSLTF